MSLFVNIIPDDILDRVFVTTETANGDLNKIKDMQVQSVFLPCAQCMLGKALASHDPEQEQACKENDGMNAFVLKKTHACAQLYTSIHGFTRSKINCNSSCCVS